jgi:hypothetical protein
MQDLRQSKLIQRSKNEKAAKSIHTRIHNHAAKVSKYNSGKFVDVYASDEGCEVTEDAMVDLEIGYEATFQRLEKELITHLKSCMVCNPLPGPEKDKKMCFMTKYGQHRKLSLEQMREWVDALMAKEGAVCICSDITLSKY